MESQSIVTRDQMVRDCAMTMTYSKNMIRCQFCSVSPAMSPDGRHGGSAGNRRALQGIIGWLGGHVMPIEIAEAGSPATAFARGVTSERGQDEARAQAAKG
jgi:hypothetical protein